MGFVANSLRLTRLDATGDLANALDSLTLSMKGAASVLVKFTLTNEWLTATPVANNLEAMTMPVATQEQIEAHTCAACGEEFSTEYEAANPADHDCPGPGNPVEAATGHEDYGNARDADEPYDDSNCHCPECVDGPVVGCVCGHCVLARSARLDRQRDRRARRDAETAERFVVSCGNHLTCLRCNQCFSANDEHDCQTAVAPF